MKAVLDFFFLFVLFSVIVRQKVVINENVGFTDHGLRIHLLDCSKLAINCKSDSGINICQHGVIVNFFGIAVFLLSSLVTGPSFMSIINGSRVMKIFIRAS